MMNQTYFNPSEQEAIPLSDQFMTWKELVKTPYDKGTTDPYTKTRVILMNGIEYNAILGAHEFDRMTEVSDEEKAAVALMRRIDSLQQQTVEWLNPSDQSILETTISYEQLATDLTSNLAKNEQNDYFRQTLNFALLEDFDHLYRYSVLLEMLELTDPNDLTKGTVDIKPGRPTIDHHRHPHEELRDHFSNDKASIKTKMNYFTIVSAEQQTENYYKTHGSMFENTLARQIYSEIADVEEQHVTQYELAGEPITSPFEMMTLMELCEAYNYYSCAQTEVNDRIRPIWETFMQMEIAHLQGCERMMEKHDGTTLKDLMKTDRVEPLIVLEPNKEYVNKILKEQVNLQPLDKKFVDKNQLPKNWPTFHYRDIVNRDGVPTEELIKQVQQIEGTKHITV